MSQFGGEIIKIVNELQDKLNPLGENLIIDLPQIAVIGGQSSGKSSVLESIVGKDFLPRGSDEITAETDREVPESKGISAKPINLKIYSPDVLDLTLVDLPGMTRMAVGNQPKDIDQLIENMLLNYIENDNCLILAVTAANQDLATSDALKLAKDVDPSGERTIGVLTKLDLMDEGTDARDILNGRHEIHLRRNFIGVKLRSQKDILTNKSIGEALHDEHQFFIGHPAYGPEMADKMGIRYLQEYLQTELSNHIFKRLPPLKPKLEAKLNEINERLRIIQEMSEVSDNAMVISEAMELLKRGFDSEVGGKSWKVSTTRRNGGTKIRAIINDKYAAEVNKIFFDDNSITDQIDIAIDNAFGTHSGMFTPDTAVVSVVDNQIELFRNISLTCVDWVTDEIINIVINCIETIKGTPKLKTPNSRLNRELSEPSSPISPQQTQTPQTVMSAILNQNMPRAHWISYNNIKYWFVLSGGTLSWFKHEKKKSSEGSAVLNGAYISTEEEILLVLIYLDKKSKRQVLELVFDSRDETEQWRDWLIEAGVRYNPNRPIPPPTAPISPSYSMATLNTVDVSYPSNKDQQIETIKKLVDAYMIILEKNFKDTMPKLCQSQLIDSTSDFIAFRLRATIDKNFNTTDDIVGDNGHRQAVFDLQKRHKLYTEAIVVINKFSTIKFTSALHNPQSFA
ncbi:unnamed protein product [Oppiella nova]|uniref:Dynamin-type G domain-containing protein n=1 Tax=Oppiella nova TaxID=334625 RepID=A0A7R9QPS6_9ACAR|nr:unnamed protein product [Oppiella nova]CAG2169289.1 unnamed protein product [Oppiella nova]